MSEETKKETAMEKKEDPREQEKQLTFDSPEYDITKEELSLAELVEREKKKESEE